METNKLPDCDDDVYEHGEVVAVVDVSKEEAEHLCAKATADTGRKHDWHYSGGRVVIKALPLGFTKQAPAPQRPVLQNWVMYLPMMQQTVLLTAIRGPDNWPKYGGGVKMLLRWYRRCVLLSAMDGKVLHSPLVAGGGSFTGPSIEGQDEELDPWYEQMQAIVNEYLQQLDALPHHWQMHFMHAVEILGYKHPAPSVAMFWKGVYERLAHDMHLWPETEAQMDRRLGDTVEGWLERSDPATTK